MYVVVTLNILHLSRHTISKRLPTPAIVHTLSTLQMGITLVIVLA